MDPRPAEFFTKYHERVRRRPARLRCTGSCGSSSRRSSCCSTASGRSTSTTCLSTGRSCSRPTTSASGITSSWPCCCGGEVQFMAKSQLFKPPLIDFILNHGGVFPGAAGPARRGGVHHGAHDLRPRRHGADVRRGRALAHRASSASPSRASAGSRSSPACPVVPVAIHGSEHVRDASRGVSRRSRSSSASRSSFEQVDAPDEGAVAGGRRADLRPRDGRCTRRSAAQGRRGVLAPAAPGAPRRRTGHRANASAA